jgi:hypothetical protein
VSTAVLSGATRRTAAMGVLAKPTLRVHHVRGLERGGLHVPLLAILGTESGYRAVPQLGLLRAVRVSERPEWN